MWGGKNTGMTRLIPCWLALAVALVVIGGPARAEVELAVLGQPGPWPYIASMIGYGGRLWCANSVKFEDHNSADLYSYDPRTGDWRYERHLFSQDTGDPAVVDGLLYWPFEDSRFSLGFGHVAVTDGSEWRLRVLASARIFHAQALAAAGGEIYAATSAWRAGIQASGDGGLTWRQVYDRPTPARRVSRIVKLAALGDRLFGDVVDRASRPPGRSLLAIDGGAVRPVPGWPTGSANRALAPLGKWLYGLVAEAAGPAIWRTDGVVSERVGDKPPAGLRDLASDGTALWGLSGADDGGRVWRSADGQRWRPHARFAGGTALGLAVYAGRAYVGGKGTDGRGILWGPPPPAPVAEGSAAGKLAEPQPAAVDWATVGAALDRALADPASYTGHGSRLTAMLLPLTAAGPPAGFFDRRLAGPFPDVDVPMMGGRLTLPSRRLARWILLWAIGLSGRGHVPPDDLRVPWSVPANGAEKYFEPLLAALWAVGWTGQADRATTAALIDRLATSGDPLWLTGDVVGALTATTGRRFGYDRAAWRDWWATAAAAWPR